MEDWQSEKCEVTLLEGVPVDMVLRKLDEAYAWLRESGLQAEWVEALCDRLGLYRVRTLLSAVRELISKHTQTLLQLLNASHIGNIEDIRPLVAIVRNILRRVRARPSPTPNENSAALTAFDPRVTRRLHTVMPTREVEIPPQDDVWDDIERLLSDWENVANLRETHTLMAWQVNILRRGIRIKLIPVQVNGSLGVWLPDRKLSLAYIRSLAQVSEPIYSCGAIVDKHFSSECSSTITSYWATTRKTGS